MIPNIPPVFRYPDDDEPVITNIVTFAALDRFYAGQGPCPCCGAEWQGDPRVYSFCSHADGCTLLDDEDDDA